ncbi:eukaryotic translation initiation factor 2C 2 [Planoprotostelium fungivorum]|uniref:Eukaryotic translation initiation factor 2C 2 n=1 Tax=Planoprotostelium fungivorum TaxID=1890364 RepID=A0A2P6N1J1_9EUKA|nr:eukaryotic translation initiation factor 2C 2 [Planoprotostelium fungivorum]
MDRRSRDDYGDRRGGPQRDQREDRDNRGNKRFDRDNRGGAPSAYQRPPYSGGAGRVHREYIDIVTNLYPVDFDQTILDNVTQYEVAIVNRFNEPLGKKPDEIDQKKFLINRLFSTPMFSNIRVIYDGGRMLYTLNGRLERAQDIQPKEDFIKQGGREVKPLPQNVLDSIRSLESDPNTLSYEFRGDDTFWYKIMARVTSFDRSKPDQFLHTVLNYSLFVDHAGGSHPQHRLIRQNAIFRDPIAMRSSSFHQRKFVPPKSLWIGNTQSFRSTKAGLMLNVDMCVTMSTWRGRVLDYFACLLNRQVDHIINRSDDDRMWNEVNRNCRGLTFYCDYSKRKMKLNSVVYGKTPKDHSFSHDGRQVNVEQYCRERYNVNLRYPHLPMALVKKKRQGEDEDSWFPLELLIVVDSQFPKDISGDETAAMIKHACKKPHERFPALDQYVANTLSRSHSLRQLDVNVHPSPATCQARVLPSRETLFGRNHREQVNDAGWVLRSKTFIEPHREERGEVPWAIMGNLQSFSPNEMDTIKQVFCPGIVRVARESGVMLNNMPFPNFRWNPNGDASTSLDAQLGEFFRNHYPARAKFILFVLREKRTDLWKEIKYLCDAKYGIPSKCVIYDAKKITNPQVHANIISSINARLNGHNWIIGNIRNLPPVNHNLAPFFNFQGQGLCVMGLDVCHGRTQYEGRDAIEIESRVALTASRENNYVKYDTVMSKQEHRKEFVDISALVDRLFANYRNKNRPLPTHILFYRDGVANSMFEELERQEIDPLENQLEKIYSAAGLKKPRLTFIVVVKRHHFRAAEIKDNRLHNVPPGTVLYSMPNGDRSLVDIEGPKGRINFYLWSHLAGLGTARPGHYYVIKNDMNAQMEQLIDFTYSLSHLLQGCTKGVSAPVPVVLAHKAAARASAYFGAQVEAHEAVRDQYFMA